MQQKLIQPTQKQMFFRYMKNSSLFWFGPPGWKAWSLFGTLVAFIFLQLLVQYLINFWNRDFFNALDKRDVARLKYEALAFIPLAVSSIVIAIVTVWAKMTLQRDWREWLSRYLIAFWFKDNNYRHLTALKSRRVNAEYRIAEDARVATDLPIDLVLGFLSAILTAITFISILWEVGGTLHVNSYAIPGYLVFSAVAYSGMLTLSMILVGRNLTEAVEGKNHSEAEFRSAASRLREHGEGMIPSEREKEEQEAVKTSLNLVIDWWRNLCWQLMRTTFIAHGNGLIAPIVGLLLCTPKYLTEGMSLGQVVQATAAFVTVQASFNWFMDNYPRIADWLSSANRVSFLLLSFDELEKEDGDSP